ncbi:hypothetical protein [Streptomyces sp. RFCAC02]|uniref:hypothetical protein n=1 Tax=Streptomyces sp. RFCAC02 TaxID=2499143 RepID=UPI00102168AE|nr:hypothetical protein [Streptomyces sp. RFCAC02]
MADGGDLLVARGEDGAIRVSDGGAALAACPDAAVAVLDVAGGVLSRPVVGDPAPPVADVYDERRAQQWLWAVYGERVAAAVHACAAGERTGVRVPADTTALTGAAARLALAHWAGRWWPASHLDGTPALDPDLLGLELAALTHRCQQVFDDLGDQPDDRAAELIDEHRAGLDPLIRWWRGAPRPSDVADRLGGVLRLIDGAADCAGLDGPELRRLRTSLDADRTAVAPADPGALFARGGGYALAAGGRTGPGARVIARGTGVNDWRRYPPGLVDASEDAVSWTAAALGARRVIDVEAVAYDAGRAARVPLVAEVRVNGRPYRVPLAGRDDVWAGRADLDLPETVAPPRIEVGVLLPGFDPEPGTDGRAGRDAVRALARRRLADAAYGARGSFLAEIAAAPDEDY